MQCKYNNINELQINRIVKKPIVLLKRVKKTSENGC